LIFFEIVKKTVSTADSPQFKDEPVKDLQVSKHWANAVNPSKDEMFVIIAEDDDQEEKSAKSEKDRRRAKSKATAPETEEVKINSFIIIDLSNVQCVQCFCFVLFCFFFPV